MIDITTLKAYIISVDKLRAQIGGIENGIINN